MATHVYVYIKHPFNSLYLSFQCTAVESKHIWHLKPKSEITREESSSAETTFTLDHFSTHVHPSLNVGQTHPSCFLRNLRQQLDHNATHTSSHCHPQSVLCQGAAENHNHDRKAIYGGANENKIKKKNAIDDDCKEAGRQSCKTESGLVEHTCHHSHKLSLTVWGGCCLLCTEYLNVPLCETACCKDKGCRDGNVNLSADLTTPILLSLWYLLHSMCKMWLFIQNNISLFFLSHSLSLHLKLHPLLVSSCTHLCFLSITHSICFLYCKKGLIQWGEKSKDWSPDKHYYRGLWPKTNPQDTHANINRTSVQI